MADQFHSVLWGLMWWGEVWVVPIGGVVGFVLGWAVWVDRGGEGVGWMGAGLVGSALVVLVGLVVL